jgi:3-isopropylmalate dehydrogenase
MTALKRIAIIGGDGIGPEVLAEATPLLDWAQSRGRALEVVHFPFSANHYLSTGEILSDTSFATLRDQFDAILFGAIGDARVPDGRHAEGILLRLRRDLELFVNHRPCYPMTDQLVPLKNIAASQIRIDVLRENTEGPYCLQGSSEQIGQPDERAIDIALHTRSVVERLLEQAFLLARQRKVGLVLAHKANVLKHGHGVWLRALEACRARFPEVEARGQLVDAMLHDLIRDPRPYGVIAADNMLGDLLTDALAAFQGGLGFAASANIAAHAPFRCTGLFEPVHGSAPNLVGLQRANPCGAILSAALMLRHLGWAEEADAVEAAVSATVQHGEATPDAGGTLATGAMGAAIRQRLGWR